MACDRHILVVDDDLDIREAVVDTLTDEGHRAVAVADGPAALAYLREMPAPCLVLLDWNMAPLNGGQVMAEVARVPAWSDIPFVLLTADSRIDDKAGAGRFVAAVRKPVDLARLFALIEQYCR